ncbi:MAG: glycosyltransferase family 1 protein, partial [Chthoniobacteraceae bacterium]
MKIILITPGTGSYYCGVCMRDNALATELIRQGHDALMVPLYLPLQLDEPSASPNAPTFFGGINVYLQQKSSIFRRTPRWLDRVFDLPRVLRMAGERQGNADRELIGETTYSMLRGDEGYQRKELRRLIRWLKSEIRPDAIWLSTMLLTGFARELKRHLGVPVLASLQGEDEFLDGLPKPWNRRSWELIIER